MIVGGVAVGASKLWPLESSHKSVSQSSSASSISTSVTQAQGIASIMSANGMTNRGIVAYGAPLESNTGTFSTLEEALAYYLSQGFTVYPWQDGSNGYTSDLATIVSAYKAAKGIVLGPLYGYGYADCFFDPATGQTNIASILPTEQDFVLTGPPSAPALSPATAYGFQCVTWETPLLYARWQMLYATIFQNVGTNGLAGISGWPNSDHGVNYGEVQGQSAGHNMNTYARYVNNTPGFPTNFYLQDVTSTGAHVADGTPCLLWSLVGASDNFSPSQCQPDTGMAVDVQTYHHGGYNESVPTVSQTSSFSLYCATANSWLEYKILQNLQANNPAFGFSRTAMPLGIIDNTSYSEEPIEVTAASIYAPAASTPALLQVDYFNFANPGDNSSDYGETGEVGVASPSTVEYFWTTVVPSNPDWPLVEADTDPGYIVAQVEATNWTQYASTYTQMTLSGLFAPPTTSSDVIVNILGERDAKKQIWLSNPSEVSKKVRFYAPEEALDVRNPENVLDLFSHRVVSTGSGDFDFQVDVPARGWSLLTLPAPVNRP